MTKTVAIHQPNFFPWLGYFDKIRRADIFIFLDDVQFQKTGGTWSNRVKLLVGGEARWITAPVIRSFSGTRRVDEIEFSPESRWREKFLRTLNAAYRRAPFYDEVISAIAPLIENEENNVARYNVTAIRKLTALLGLSPGKFHRSSELQAQGNATALLIDLIRAVDGSAYLCGGGAYGYQDDDAFGEAGLGPIYQGFRHPLYPQIGSADFVAGLSIVDGLMNIGIKGIRDLLQGNDGSESRTLS